MKLKVLVEYFDNNFKKELKVGEIIEVDKERGAVLLGHPLKLVEKIEEMSKKEEKMPTAEESFIEIETAVKEMDEKIETADKKIKKVPKKKKVEE